jgi:hypothetical protein
LGMGEKFSGLIHVQWVKAIGTVLLSHVWYSGWSLLALPHWIYYVGFASVLLGFCGLLYARKTFTDAKTFALLSFYTFFWLGQAYQIVMLFLSKGSSTAMGGWYLYSVVWAEVPLWIIGIFALVPARFHRRAFILIITCLAAVDLYAVHFVLIPFYAHSKDLLGVNITSLLINKPAVLTPHVFFVLWAIFLASTAVVLLIGANALICANTKVLSPPRSLTCDSD